MQNNINYRVSALRKYIGSGQKSKGLLNLLLEMNEECYIYPHELKNIEKSYEQYQIVFQKESQNVQVIAPLNSDENEEIYTFFHNRIQVPVYPFLLNFICSKWLAHFTFAPYAAKCFFFPEGCSPLPYLAKIRAIAKTEKITHLILKDEHDVDIRSVIPYAICSPEKLENYCHNFEQKSKGIPNIGGLLIEEFMCTNQVIHIYKMHNFMGSIPKSGIHSTVKMKNYTEGGFFEKLIESSKEEIGDVPLDLTSKLNPTLIRFYPYLFNSFDFILQDNIPRIIDVNSVANSFNNIPPNMDMDAPFRYFIQKCKAENNTDGLRFQLEYNKKMRILYENLRKLGPCFISGDRAIQLDSGLEFSVQDALACCLLGDFSPLLDQSLKENLKLKTPATSTH
jgi:hypothetical protein